MLYDPRLPPRFWSMTEVCKTTGCWLWTGSLDHLGYAQFSTGSRTNHTRRNNKGHRYAYQALVGEIPAGLVIDHYECSNRRCVNPSHLRAVTQRANSLRSETSAAALNAAKTHCPNGHEYTATNTYISKLAKRYCKTCKRLKMRAKRAARRQLLLP